MTSQHILNTSANLLGFCLIVITSLKVNNNASGLLDEFTCIIAVLLICSCLFSFFSIRTKEPARAKRTETIADYLFLTSLSGILVIVVLITLNFIG